jgi:hypothetical protein
MEMECKQCIAENKIMISRQGSGYGYIGTSYNCQRHNPNEVKINKTVEPIIWTNYKPYEKTHICKNNK